MPKRIEQYLADNRFPAETYVYDEGVVKGFIRVSENEIKKLFVEPVLQGNAIAFYTGNGFFVTDERKYEENTTEYLVCMERGTKWNE